MSHIKSFKVGVKNVVIGNNAVENILEIHILDTVQDKTYFDWWTGEVFVENLVEQVINEVKRNEPKNIKLIIDSEGGDAQKGLTLYNFLKSYKAKVETEVIGMAGSIASVLAMAASPGKLSIARNGFVVIHRAWGGAIGNSDDLRAAANMIDKYTDQICDIYAQRTGKSVEEIKGLIANGDYWMTGVEAQAQGFADKVFNDNPQFQIAARVQSLDKHYKNVPQNLVHIEPPAPQNEPVHSQTEQTIFMEIKKLVSNFINGLKPKPAKEGEEPPTPSNEVKQFSEAVEKPLESFLSDVQNEVSKEAKEQVKNHLDTNDTFKQLLQDVKNLKEENSTLKQQVKDLIGGEGGAGGEGGQGGDKTMRGRFV
ncbi:MAG TPA: hypothetical protein DCL43_09455 [Chitinophagaceae bacterium]|nr:hypothetical protein [Chitinophagaceae bacterium]